MHNFRWLDKYQRRTTWRLCIAVILLGGGSSCRNQPTTIFTEVVAARQITSDLRIAFAKANQATDQAVMAITDEMSIKFAGDAERALQTVDAALAALQPHLRALHRPMEIMLAKQFGQQLAQYLALDRSIRELAVENSNLKAQRLSFGPAAQAASAFKAALKQMAQGAAARNNARLQALVAGAVIAVLEIQVLHAPHIAEADDAAMTKMEAKMADLQTQAAADLTALAPLANDSVRPALLAASAAFDRFTKLGTEIIGLSRRNSNVRSLDLALQQKPAAASACDNSLNLLQEELAKDVFSGTR